MDRPLEVSQNAAVGLIALLLAFFALGLLGSPAQAAAPKPPKGAIKVNPANVVSIAKGVWCAKSPGNWKSYVPGKRLLIGKGKRKKTFFISALQQAKQARSAGQAKQFEKTHRRYLKKCQKIKPLRFKIRGAIGLARSKKKPRSLGRAATLESNLQTILPSGVLREAVASGWANVQGYWFAPNGNILLYIQAVDLNNATYLPEAGGCAFIEVDRASGIPSCIDPEIIGINSFGKTSGEVVQFDSLGNIYYVGWAGDLEKPETVRTVLRKRSPSGEIVQLSDGAEISSFQLLPDNSVLAIGFEDCSPPFNQCSGPSTSWLKRFTAPPSESAETLLSTSQALSPQALLFGLSLFPDGNVYFFLADQDPALQDRQTFPINQRIMRYLPAEKRLDLKPWISFNEALAPSWALRSVCTPDAIQASLWPCAPTTFYSTESKLYWGNTATTSTGEVFVAAPNSFYQAYPGLSIVRTSATLPLVGSPSAEACITQTEKTVIYCGGDENGTNRDEIKQLNFATGTERTLLGPETGLAPYQVGVAPSGKSVIFVAGRSGGRVMGEIDLGTGEVAVLRTLKYDLLDFLVFGSG